MNKHTIDQLLISAEVFHYARKHRGRTFMVLLEDSNKLEEMIEDLRILDLANIHLDFAVLSCQMGSLYQEIFTHYGAGTMFSDKEVSKLRKARPEDTMDIFWLMKPYIANGLLLPVTDDEILATIESYFVLTADRAIVACAKLIDFGNACEFAKLCALPRYRGRGRACSLVGRLIKNAAARKRTTYLL